MFRTVIKKSPCVDGAVAERLFGRVSGKAILGDVSLLSSLRLLLKERMPEEENLQIVYKHTGIPKCDSMSPEEIINAVQGLTPVPYNNQNEFVLHSIAPQPDGTVTQCFSAIRAHMAANFPKLEENEAVTLFFSKAFPVLCFNSPEEKSVFIFVERLDKKKLHYMQVAIPTYLPWYFEDFLTAAKNGKHLTDFPLENQLLNAMQSNTSDLYYEFLYGTSDRFNLRDATIREHLNQFETKFERGEVSRLEQQVRAERESIRQLNADIGYRFEILNKNIAALLGFRLKAETEGADSEIMEYFLCNKKLTIDEVVDTALYYSVKDYLTYWDKEMAERVISNRSSYIYDTGSRRPCDYITRDQCKRFFRAIFLDETLRVKFCAAYKLLPSQGLFAVRDHVFEFGFQDAMPNTHIQTHSCIGGFEKIFNECILNRDYIAALEQSVASAKSLNFADSTVMGNFIIEIMRFRCVELPDGRTVTVGEAVEYLDSLLPEGEASVEAQPAGEIVSVSEEVAGVVEDDGTVVIPF